MMTAANRECLFLRSCVSSSIRTLICSRMRSVQRSVSTYSSCLRPLGPTRYHPTALPARLFRTDLTRGFVSATRLQDEQSAVTKSHDEAQTKDLHEEKGAMSRRLSDMAEESMNTGSKSDRKTMSEAGFSEDLKQQLEERIAQSAFKSYDQKAMSEATMPTAAGKGTRDQAAAQAWTGTESMHDATLRMLDDSHKKLRSPSRIPRPTANLRPAPKARNVSAADRLASARDKTSIYAFSQQNDMTEEEREKMRKELKERFQPGARPMPTSLQGLTSLANERIEDAIARGQFKNIQRGKGVNTERDYAANSPFLDTTEYFMNKIIQKQEIVPPWIEKQQELVKLVSSFRARLRNDWRRHAARMLASEGGTIEDQVRKARSYAITEEMVNPRQGQTEKMSSIDATGTLSTVTIEERLAAGIEPIQNGTAPEVEIKVVETAPEDAPKLEDQQLASEQSVTPSAPPQVQSSKTSLPSSRVLPMPYPFRDPVWERTEAGYHNLAVQEINSLTRSYNLMAPKIAQKPYYTVARELNRCYAEVASLLPDEILERSRKPKIRVEVVGHREGGVMAKFQGSGHVGTVRDEDQKKGYGFKEFWKDLFSKDERVGQKRKSMV